jgi:hypothetical protein
MQTKCIQTGNTIKFLHPITWVSKYCDQWCQHCSCGEWHFQCRKSSVCSAIMNHSAWLQSKGDSIQHLVCNHQWKCPSTSDKNCSISLIAYAKKGKALVHNQSLKLKVNKICMASICSPRRSTKYTAQQLTMPQVTVLKFLWCLMFRSYKYQILRHLTA